MIKNRTFFILATLHLLTFFSCGQKARTVDTHSKQKDSLITVKNIDIIVYELAIPSRDTHNMFLVTRIAIKKDDIKPTFLKFQSGGTETNVSIIDSAYSQNYKNIWDTPSTKQLNFGHNESGLLDISDLKKGTYFVRYSSCNIGGNYTLIFD